MARSSWRATAAALAACAVLPLVFSLLVAWADLEVPGNFSVYGCSGTAAVTEYRSQYMTRVVEGPQTACYPLFLFWDSPDESSKDGIRNIRLGQPLLTVGIALSVAAVLLLALPADGTRFLGAGTAVVALLAVALGAGLLQAGLADHADADERIERASGGSGEGAFSWRAGPWLAYGGASLLLAAGVLGFLPVRSDDVTPVPPRPGPLPVGRLPPTDEDEAEDEEDVQAAPGDRPGGAGPASRARGAEGVASAADAERGPRRLVCPRCQHRFVGAWGVTPRCPQCGYMRNGGPAT